MEPDIKKALEVLKNGGVILYPTDTIWGLGCDATNKDAVEKIYRIKAREAQKNLLILVDKPEMIPSYVDQMPDIAWDLIDYADKPLTIIYSGAKNLAENLINKEKTIGIRAVQDEFCQKLIQNFRKPIVSTSPNLSGEPHPRSFEEISDEIINKVDYVVDWKQNEYSLENPSSIIKLEPDGLFSIIRP